MRFIKRAGYFLYYLKKLDWPTFKKFKAFATQRYYVSGLKLWWRIFVDSVQYNISILEYFQFGFYKISSAEKASYAGTGYMYEYQLRMNPQPYREVLQNKIEFLRVFEKFTHRKFVELSEIKNEPSLLNPILKSPSAKVVLKGSRGQIGAEVQIMDASRFADPESLVHYMEQENMDMAEEYVVQHSALMKLSPSGLNTVRVITQIADNHVVIIGARLRITINSTVDNLAAGNAAAPIDLESGVISGAAVFSDITKPEIDIHPISKVSITGFQVPFWNEVKQLVIQAAKVVPQNRSVGWDVGVTEHGPLLIEGNHNWCKLLWQLPVKRGLKNEIEQY